MAPSLKDVASFFYRQLFVTPKYPTESCEGKTIIVTGANVGLGYEAAKHFTRLGAKKVILACRNMEKGKKAASSIESAENRVGVVEVWELDLSNYESVKKFAKRVDGLDRVDAVVENAGRSDSCRGKFLVSSFADWTSGILTQTYAMTEDNEATLTVNVVSTFLLALLLLPTLKRSAEKYAITPRLVIVSSEVHFFTSFPERNQPSIFDYLNDKQTANMEDRYNVSKLLEVLTVRELCQKHISQPYPVIVNCLNPGLCHSELARDVDSFAFRVMKKLLARTTEVGSRTLVASAVAGRESHGQYMSDGVVAAPAALVTSEDGKRAQAQVWKELSQKLETIQPGITSKL